jgi:adenosylcobinamide kinase/adenosylcobinamide-phosphate guanylyltransferase
VAAHRGRRPARWRTRETLDLEALLAAHDDPPLLVDDLGLWLAGVVDGLAAWEDPTRLPALRERVDGLVAAWRSTRRRAVAVSPEVGGGVVPATRSGRLFRDELGRLNAALAAAADEVVLVVAGLPLRLK